MRFCYAHSSARNSWKLWIAASDAWVCGSREALLLYLCLHCKLFLHLLVLGHPVFPLVPVLHKQKMHCVLKWFCCSRTAVLCSSLKFPHEAVGCLQRPQDSPAASLATGEAQRTSPSVLCCLPFQRHRSVFKCGTGSLIYLSDITKPSGTENAVLGDVQKPFSNVSSFSLSGNRTFKEQFYTYLSLLNCSFFPTVNWLVLILNLAFVKPL